MGSWYDKVENKLNCYIGVWVCKQSESETLERDDVGGIFLLTILTIKKLNTDIKNKEKKCTF